MTASAHDFERNYEPRIIPLEPLGASRRRTWTRWLAGLSVLIVALLSWLGYRLLALPVATTVSAAGFVEPVTIRTVRSTLAGRISDIVVNAGDTVLSGQVLARLDDRSLRSQLADLHHQIAGLRLQQRRDEASRVVDRRKTALDRHTARLDLVDARGRLSQQSLLFLGRIVDVDSVLANYVPGTNVGMDAAVNGVMRVRNRMESLDLQQRSLDAESLDSLQTVEKILQLEARSRDLERQIRESTVRSPIGGVVQTPDLATMIGRQLSPGEALLDVAELSSWVARLFVSAADVSRIRVGDTVRITLDPLADLMDGPTTATVQHVAVRPTTREGSQGRFEVIAALVRPSPRVADALRSGLPTRADIVTARAKGLSLVDEWLRRKLGRHGRVH
ncbi:MAG: HlyD family efflux transporter periplasmic adaptor subunit [Gemmatimonadetes bacterium]|nr:HlyD family efflux transporter periplasmic adaptor subunit [Gemmatimonadota bacterium]